jgi:adenylate cyclase
MREPISSEHWRRVLTGEIGGLRILRRIHKTIPSEPRCKFCYVPFGKPGGLVLGLLGGKPSPMNRRLCTWCMKKAHKYPGGAEVEISVMFADVRGSTALAERLPPGEFGQLLIRFWGTAARVIDRGDGIVDKFVGDEAVALFIPGFAGKDHAARAIESAGELLAETGHGDPEPWIPIGIGVHTGVSLVGYLGEGDARDFTAVGDTVNTAARLTSMAGLGEILISDAAANAAGLNTSSLEKRTLELRGRKQSVNAWVQPAASSAATAAICTPVT